MFLYLEDVEEFKKWLAQQQIAILGDGQTILLSNDEGAESTEGAMVSEYVCVLA